ncbi:relaxase [Flavobacterium zepuense]|uniref:Relaxase n=1 Tax=Flavobacterium zepuense TaxID=2593302 RepID=A0A552UUN8_9FLAO|nr:relaxase/mobilization nuclease domain-containing protein [Flavobacterium zepuense]TRW21932.1 relaxase [Flavobacterium zepuense]
MVAVVKTGRSVHRIFNYNENKVKEGKAEIIGAGNYPFDPEKTTITMRLNRLLWQMELRPDVKVNSVHISLNFDPSEINLPKEKLMQIAEAYMEKLGFGNQPFLVYQHHDAGHPHLHLVTTNITADSKRISLHHIGIEKSEPARREVEQRFGLIAAQGQKESAANKLQPISIGKVTYGRVESKKALQLVLENIVADYRYTSLAELNAVLRQYNVQADRGTEGSRIFKTGGLVYHILDSGGKPVGVPIKASAFYNKPTLKSLEEKYNSNEVKRIPHKGRVKNAIDVALLGGKTSLRGFISALEKQGIHVALRQNESGLIYGITYVDHTTKCVFNGSALGKQYSAKAIPERCLQEVLPGQQLPGQAVPTQTGLQPHAGAGAAETKDEEISTGAANLLDALMQPEFIPDYLPHQLKGKKKKRRKNKRNNNNL